MSSSQHASTRQERVISSFVILIVNFIPDDPRKAQLGMENLQIGANQLFTIHYHSASHPVDMVRLNQIGLSASLKLPSSEPAWDSLYFNVFSWSVCWVRVYLGIDHEVHGVIIQGLTAQIDRWVTEFELRYSMDNLNFEQHKLEGTDTRKVWSTS